MSEDFIDYGILIDEAMHIIVQKALERVQKKGLPGNHHFFISFLTEYPGVGLSDKLKSKYPEEMTIVIQYQYEDLFVDRTHFSITLSFDGVKESISVPFSALTSFADPSVKFGLQFRHLDMEEIEDELEVEEEFEQTFDVDNNDAITNNNESKDTTQKTKARRKKSKAKINKGDNIIDLDSFRKK